MRWLFALFFTFYGGLIMVDIIGVMKPWEWGLAVDNKVLFGIVALLLIPTGFCCWHLLDQEGEDTQEEQSLP